jgi:hypothetical protein
MDKKRWLIIMSVFFSMGTLLFVLNLVTPSKKVQAPKTVTKVQPKRTGIKDFFFTHEEEKPLSSRVRQHGNIVYPEPAKHTFNIEGSFKQEQNHEEMKTKGKIIK